MAAISPFGESAHSGELLSRRAMVTPPQPARQPRQGHEANECVQRNQPREWCSGSCRRLAVLVMGLPMDNRVERPPWLLAHSAQLLCAGRRCFTLGGHSAAAEARRANPSTRQARRSATGVPDSACLRANGICSSVYCSLTIENSPLRVVPKVETLHPGWIKKRGGRHIPQLSREPWCENREGVIFAIRVDPADVVIRVSDVAIGKQRQIFAAGAVEFRRRLGQGSRSAVGADC